MKKILGLDLGIASVGWAFVQEAENESEQSKIIKSGVRVVPITTEEKNDFQKGRPLSLNASRTLKRGMRRNLHRFKLRRANLIHFLIHQLHFIDAQTPLREEGKKNTHETLKLRATAATAKISEAEIARVLLSINKKRGYKSSRKAKNEEEGQLIDGMQIARQLYENKITPGQFALNILNSGKKYIPDFYRSDLQQEFDQIWEFQQTYHEEVLTADLYKKLKGQGRKNTVSIFLKEAGVDTVKQTSKNKKLEMYQWRAEALESPLTIDVLASVLSDINGSIASSSGYLGEISDRSKQLIIQNLTVGQYLYQQLEKNPHTRLKNQVFYRQDYLDEFEQIWETQSQYYPQMTPKLKEEARDIIIFYQRKLKSQKHLISKCEFENNNKVVPKSSPLFQEFRILQTLNHTSIVNEDTGELFALKDHLEWRDILFDALSVNEKLKTIEILKLLKLPAKKWKLTYGNELIGNRTNHKLIKTFVKILESEEMPVSLNKLSPHETLDAIRQGFDQLGIDSKALVFHSDIPGKSLEKQAAYQLWHLLYAAEDELTTIEEYDGTYGTQNIRLRKKLCEKFGFKPDHSKILSGITFENDYGNLSTTAIRKICPFLKAGKRYDEACVAAGYRHSQQLTKEEIANKDVQPAIALLKKNSLRNPVVEKMLNQMINVVNMVIAHPKMGNPDEIRIELSRDLKKNAKERQSLTTAIYQNTQNNERIRKIIQEKYKIQRPTGNDIVRYKLYEELKPLGFKSIYTGTYIQEDQLFTKDIEIEHIIPKARVFDDSFSNKTLAFHQVNQLKDKQTAVDFISNQYSTEEKEQFLMRVRQLRLSNTISGTKYKKLLMSAVDIPDDFINRDIKETQYISRKAIELLEPITKTITPTTGTITARLRKDWGIEQLLKEISLEKYNALQEITTNKEGKKIIKIKGWSKRNDHRHHAVDAITVAFTTPSHIQYLNNLNAKESENQKSSELYGIQEKITFKDKNNSSRKFVRPFHQFRGAVKDQLANMLVSIKARNKVVTQNKNFIKRKDGEHVQDTLTPRGQLHQETVYGKKKSYIVTEEKVSTKFTREKILQVTRPAYREALLKRLSTYGEDPKKAFGGKNTPSKHPVILLKQPSLSVPETVKLKKEVIQYTIRKEIGPDLKIDKITDQHAKRVLQRRLDEFGGKPKLAFADLDKNPIWYDADKKVAMKRVTITGIANAVPLHTKSNEPIPVDFVSQGNNHHAAIYRDSEGKLQDVVVSFFEAVTRKISGLSIIDKTYKQEEGWQFLYSIKQNEYFVFPGDAFNPSEIDVTNPENYHLISPHLFRVQKFSRLSYGNSVVREYVFRHHLETTIESSKEMKGICYKELKSLPHLEGAIKVWVNHLGELYRIGEW